jgi:hypothetical protein
MVLQVQLAQQVPQELQVKMEQQVPQVQPVLLVLLVWME